MPEIEIGPFEQLVGPEGAKTTVQVLRIAFYSGGSIALPENAGSISDITPQVAALLKAQENRITDLLLAFRQGEVGFATDDAGRLVRVVYKYPDLNGGSEKGLVS